jgi:hypothetical protein
MFKRIERAPEGDDYLHSFLIPALSVIALGSASWMIIADMQPTVDAHNAAVSAVVVIEPEK